MLVTFSCLTEKQDCLWCRY